MAIKNLSNNISESDLNAMKDIKNPPMFEEGFDGSSGDNAFDGLFDSADDLFRDMNEDSTSNSSIGFGDFGLQSGESNIFGQNSSVGIQLGNLNTTANIGQQAQQKESAFDTLTNGMWKFIEVSGKSFIEAFKELLKSAKNRTADDFGYYGRNLIISGGTLAIIGVVLVAIGLTQGAEKISSGFPLEFIGTGILTCGTGISILGFSAFKAIELERTYSGMETLSDVSSIDTNDSTNEYEENIEDIFSGLLDLPDDFFDAQDNDSNTYNFDDNYSENNFKEPIFSSSNTYNNGYSNEITENLIDNIRENKYLDRRSLFETFKPFFPTNTPSFSDRIQISNGSQDFLEVETVALKALCNVTKSELSDINSYLESLYETHFSYELKLKRVKGLKNTDDIAREIEAYFREDSSDKSVNATVSIEGDFYKVIITKGTTDIVTFGDIFMDNAICEFFLDEGNKLPVIIGINELGKVVVDDAKIFDTMLISGKPRSGKSWHVFSILLCLAAFNTPEDVQFVIIDPKESNLFNTFALLPHVAGLHNDDNVLNIMADIIENEGSRRKKLLGDNRCDDIWALRKKGIKLPVLYLVIDEYITVKNNLGVLDKELDNKLQVIISQLPSLGIRLLFVPHRATGVVNKTNRTMIQYTASVKGDIEDVKDTLGISKWNRALTKPGDLAVKYSSMQEAVYLRSAAITTSDEENAKLIKNIAKAFYKMGVDMPDMSSMKTACNRDETYIKEEIQGEGRRIQYNNIDDIDI